MKFITHHAHTQVESVDGCCVLAAVGQGMVNTKGVTATMMSALAKASVNIKAIAQVGARFKKAKQRRKKEGRRELINPDALASVNKAIERTGVLSQAVKGKCAIVFTHAAGLF